MASSMMVSVRVVVTLLRHLVPIVKSTNLFEAPISFKSKKSNKDSEQPRIPMTNVTSSEEEKLD